MRWRSMLRWNDDSVSGSYSEPSFLRTDTKKWPKRRSNSVGGMSLSSLVSPCFAHHEYQVLRSDSVFHLVFLFFCWSTNASTASSSSCSTGTSLCLCSVLTVPPVIQA